MGRPCASCISPYHKEIDRRIRSGSSFIDVVRWLRDMGNPIARNAIARHATDHLGVPVHSPGPKPVSGDFLQTVVAVANDNVTSGRAVVTVRDGIAAQQQLDHRMDKATDRDLQIMWAQILGGAIPHIPIEGEYTEMDAERDEDDAEFTRLLEAG